MKQNILFIYTNFSTFVKADYEILSAEHSVTKYQFRPVKGNIQTIVSLFKQFIFLFIKIWQFDSVYIWFADTHSFLPVFFAKIAGKKSFIVVGGYDVARIPSLNYGVFNSKIRGFCAITSMKNSTQNLTVSQYVSRKVKWLTKSDNSKMIYNCVNLPKPEQTSQDKENLIITVGLINNPNTFYLKGIDTFIEVAKLLPYFKFKIIGADVEMIKNIFKKKLPENLEIIGRTNHHSLISYYKKAKIYCQFSRSEAFGVAIVEAMNYGCIPVVTNIGGMPELVEETGKTVPRDTEKISKIISKFINKDKNLVPYSSRNKLIRFFFETRKRKILKIFK